MAYKNTRTPNLDQHCKIDGCAGLGKLKSTTGKRYLQSGYCNRHYLKYRKYGDATVVKVLHGANANDKKDPIYPTYQNMKMRCLNKNNESYKYYGARGITVCDRWLGAYGFANFKKDMGNKPDNTTLDRIDVDKGYSPDNCRWAGVYQQAGNKRTSNQTVGVAWDKFRCKYRAYFNANGKQIFSKRFDSYKEAVKARKSAEKEHGIVYGN